MSLLLLGMVLFSGCAITRQDSGVHFAWKKVSFPKWNQPIALFSSGEPETEIQPESSDQVVITPQQQDGSNPFEAQKTTLVSSGSESVPENGQKTENPETDESRLVVQMLIKETFEDSPKEEREKWFQLLRDASPSEVPMLLRARKLSMQLQKESLSSPLNPNDSFATSRQRPPQDNSLTGHSPWDRESFRRENQQPYRQELSMGDAERKLTNSNSNVITVSSQKQIEKPSLISPTSLATLEQNQTVSEYSKALDQLIDLVERQVAFHGQAENKTEQDQYLKNHVYLRMLYLMANRPERALEPIPNLPQADQEFWQQMFWGMSHYFDQDGIPNSSDRATQTISQLTEAINRLKPRANLELRNVIFCTKIDSFGNYDRFERAEFVPGQPVLIYAEARNFLSEPTADGEFKTVLKSTIEIHRSGGQGGLISKQEFEPTEDVCKNRRSDYFHSYLLNIPKELSAGRYVLKLIVEDQLNSKVASYMVNFTVN